MLYNAIHGFFLGLHCTLNLSVLVFKRQPYTFKIFKPHKARPKTATVATGSLTVMRPGTQSASDDPVIHRGSQKLEASNWGFMRGFYMFLSAIRINSHQMDCGHRGSLHHGQLTATDP